MRDPADILSDAARAARGKITDDHAYWILSDALSRYDATRALRGAEREYLEATYAAQKYRIGPDIGWNVNEQDRLDDAETLARDRYCKTRDKEAHDQTT